MDGTADCCKSKPVTKLYLSIVLIKGVDRKFSRKGLATVFGLPGSRLVVIVLRTKITPSVRFRRDILFCYYVSWAES